MMKKNLLFLFLFLGTFLTLNAQTTVTNSVLPAPGDLLMTRQATSIGGISVTAPGTNLMWDYSAMVGGDLDSVTVVAASTGAFSSMFPTADVILATSILPGENYMDVSTNKVEIVGFAGDVLGLGVVIPAVFDDPLTLLETPLNYQSTFNDTATVIINVKVTDYPILVSYLNDSLGLAGTGIVVDSLRINYAAGGHQGAFTRSHLTQVRGLKLTQSACKHCKAWSHLTQVRGLKLDIDSPGGTVAGSHLTQVRGLKLIQNLLSNN